MKISLHLSTFLSSVLLLSACAEKVEPPKPMAVVPNEKQLAWFDMEFYGFIHFGPNTFTGAEWGHGEEDPNVFNPTALDTDQWAKVCKEAGMKGIVLTVKHHDGFCLYPSKYSTHTVRESNWMDGKGDVLKMLSESCRKYGLKLGVYLSPWDMNHPDFTTDKYNDVYVKTIEEVLTGYGDVFEFWYDGGDTGKNGKKQIYDWDRFDAKIRELQPQTVINGCRDLRWVGNEEGHAPETCWATISTDSVAVANARNDGSVLRIYGTGLEDGDTWAPAECDVSIRPGWFHRHSEDNRVKTVAHLFDIYLASVGRNSTLILNLAPDQRGLIPDTEVERLKQLKQYIDECFANNLALGTKVTATNTRSNCNYSAAKIINNNTNSYWATADGVRNASLTFEWREPMQVNAVMLQEYIPLGQRIKMFDIEVCDSKGNWEKVAEGTTVGRKKIVTFPTTQASALRINIIDARAEITMSNVGIYNFPILITNPTISRNNKGEVRISTESRNAVVYYTTDGSEPTSKSNLYKDAFTLEQAAQVKARVIDTVSGKSSDITQKQFDILKSKWKVIACSGNNHQSAQAAIDDNDNTLWVHKSPAAKHPYYLTVDLGEDYTLQGFTYTPRRDGSRLGNISEYSFYISENNVNWTPIYSNARFDNIANNPIEQRVVFDKPRKARYIKFETHSDTQSLENSQSTGVVTIAELGVITKQD